MGLYRAGFDVVGVDIKRQPRYPAFHDAEHAKHFRFVQADALNPPFDLSRFDLIWASPPCQAHVGFNASWNETRHVSLISETRKLLNGFPLSVIENVVGSPVRASAVLCGTHFDLGVRRHRLFETSFGVLVPQCRCSGVRLVGVYGDHPQNHLGDGYRMPRARSLSEARLAMSIEWMEWRELTQAIPPAYSEFIGQWAMRSLGKGSAAA